MIWRKNKIGKGNVFTDFILKIYDLAKKYNRKMMMWGDVIINYYDCVHKLPKDITIVEWGYESNHPYEEHCKLFSESGLDFYVCPATCSWNSFVGRTENMVDTVELAAKTGLKYGAKGMLFCDWGDWGNPHFLPISYSAIIYGLSHGWTVEGNHFENALTYVNKVIFKDEKGQTAQIIAEAGNYYKLEGERAFNCTTKLFEILKGIKEEMYYQLSQEQLNNIIDYILDKKNRLDDVDLKCEDAELIINEIKTNMDLAILIANIGKVFLLQKENGQVSNELIKIRIDEIDAISERYVACWCERNKIVGSEIFVGHLNRLKNEIKEFMTENEKISV